MEMIKQAFLIFIFMLLSFCSNPKKDNAPNHTCILYLQNVFMNYFEKDSLQKAVYPPMMYFYFETINLSKDSLLMLMPKKYTDESSSKSRLIITFDKDTLNLYVGEKNGYFTTNPNDTLVIAAATKIGDLDRFYEKSKFKTIQDLVKYIVAQGKLSYLPNLADTAITREMNDYTLIKDISFKKSNTFYLEFRDPNTKGDFDW